MNDPQRSLVPSTGGDFIIGGYPVTGTGVFADDRERAGAAPHSPRCSTKWPAQLLHHLAGRRHPHDSTAGISFSSRSADSKGGADGFAQVAAFEPPTVIATCRGPSGLLPPLGAAPNRVVRNQISSASRFRAARRAFRRANTRPHGDCRAVGLRCGTQVFRPVSATQCRPGG
jgi:hypothetical protein